MRVREVCRETRVVRAVFLVYRHVAEQFHLLCNVSLTTTNNLLFLVRQSICTCGATCAHEQMHMGPRSHMRNMLGTCISTGASTLICLQNTHKQCMHPRPLWSYQQSDPVHCSKQTACEVFLPRKRDLDLGEHLNR